MNVKELTNGINKKGKDCQRLDPTLTHYIRAGLLCIICGRDCLVMHLTFQSCRHELTFWQSLHCNLSIRGKTILSHYSIMSVCYPSFRKIATCEIGVIQVYRCRSCTGSEAIKVRANEQCCWNSRFQIPSSFTTSGYK